MWTSHKWKFEANSGYEQQCIIQTLLAYKIYLMSYDSNSSAGDYI